MDQRGSLWRQLRNQQAGLRIREFVKEKGERFLLLESKRKFFTTLDPVFWLRHSDFISIVPRHPHLTGLPLTTRHMALHDYPFGIGGTWDNETSNGKSWVGEKRKREEEAAAAMKHTKITPTASGDLPNGHI